MRSWVVDNVGWILMAIGVTAALAMWGEYTATALHERDVAVGRLDRHCTFERLQLEMLQIDLRSPRTNTVLTAERTFSTLAETDLREVKLCAPEGSPIDPGDRALACSIEFGHDHACMQAVVSSMLLYVRGAR